VARSSISFSLPRASWSWVLVSIFSFSVESRVLFCTFRPCYALGSGGLFVFFSLCCLPRCSFFRFAFPRSKELFLRRSCHIPGGVLRWVPSFCLPQRRVGSLPPPLFAFLFFVFNGGCGWFRPHPSDFRHSVNKVLSFRNACWPAVPWFFFFGFLLLRRLYPCRRFC